MNTPPPDQASRKHPMLVAAGKPITFDGLIDVARALNNSPAVIVINLLEYTRPKFKPFDVGFLDEGELFHVWQVGTAILASLATADGPITIPSQVAVIEPVKLRAFLRSAGGLEADGRVHAKTPEELHNETTKSVLRLLGFNKVMQCDFRYQLAMTLHLLGVRDAYPTPSASVSFESLFQSELQCSVTEYIQVLYTAWLTSMESNLLDLRSMFNTTKDPVRFQSLARRILDPISCPCEGIENRIQGQFREYEAEALTQAFFTTTPFVRVSPDTYFAPPAPFLRLVASTGAFFRTISLARDHWENLGSTKPWTNAHSSAMGYRFEPFIKLLLEKCKSQKDELIDEYCYHESKKGPDFFITSSSHPEAVLIIQAKLKRLSPGAFFGFSLADFEANARGVLAELIWKSIRYVFQVETYQLDQLDAAHLDLHLAIRRAKKIVLLGVVPAIPPLFHIEKFRSLVIEGVRAKLNTNEKQWLDKNTHRFDLWHILDAEEICEFVTTRSPEMRLIESLTDYLTLPEFGKLVVDQGILEPFGGWCMAIRNRAPAHRIQELDTAYTEFHENLVNEFFTPEP